ETVLDVKVGELLDTPRPEDKVPEQIKKDPDQDKGGDIDEKEISNAMN
ncbi:MAG TPA: trehalose-binding protein, partial [Thalassospira sp.]|nr:trehalose-binding protein [Thalassospira sp.]